MKRTIKFLCIFLLLITPVSASALKLSVTSTQQEKSNWCWAATAQCIAKYINGWAPSQTSIVTYVKGSAVNQGANASEEQLALKYCGLSSSYSSSSRTFSQVKADIDANRPINAGIQWTSGGGHSVVLHGYTGTAGTSSETVYYMDPWSSNSRWVTCTYSYFKSNSSFKWYRTIYNIR